jgi:predicted transcriptional regulator
MLSDDKTSDVTALTVQILSAYLANNIVAPEELAGLIRSTRVALTAEEAAPATIGQPETFAPAVSVRKSLSSPEHIISLIDAKPYKTLKRHLASHGLTPESYRERYNLAASYPMVAPAYAAHRRGIAQKIGLGRRKPTDEGVELQDASQVALIQAAAQSAKPGSGKPPVSAGPPSKRGNAAASGEGRSNSAFSSDTAEMDDTLNGAAALLTSELSPAAADKKRPSRKAKQGSNRSSAPAKASKNKAATRTKATAKATSAGIREAPAAAEANDLVANDVTKPQRRGRLSLFKNVDAQGSSPVGSATASEAEM